MPKSKTGKRVLKSMRKSYGKKRGTQIAYATANKLAKEGKPGLFKALHGRSPKKKKGA